MEMHISILGAGAWGTALAINAADRHALTLWARDPAQASALQTQRVNARYLPGAPLPERLHVTSDWDAAVAHALQAGDQGLILIAAPMSGLEDLLRALPAHAPVMWLCKGFQAGSKRLGHEIAAAVRSIDQEKTYGALSGPSFAKEVARGLPTALVAASTHHHLAGRAVEAFHGDALRVYTVNDLIGVEVGGAVKNVLAIAAGISDGLGMGLNARASLITRGLAEMTRLGVALGARAETFMGLSGLGDLVLTATGDLSRNRQVGLQLAEGKTLDDILQHLGHVAEGVYSAVTVQQRAQERQVDMPIVDAVVSVLQGMATPQEAVQALMRRVARPEVI